MTEQLQETEKRAWTILDLLNWGTDYLAGRKFDNPRLNVELLLAAALGCGRVQLYTNFDKPLSPSELSTFKKLFERRLAHEPIQYIRGETEFLSHRFLLTRDVLIPRPETEILVEKVIEQCKQKCQDRRVIKILDFGTGCGNIAISIANHVENAEVIGFDISENAIAVAQKNLGLHGLKGRVKFAVLDLFAPLEEGFRAKVEMVVSNPPYISKQEFDRLMPEVREYEPRIATCDEDDGFRFHRRIADLAKALLAPGGWLFLEVGFNQAKDVREILQQRGLKNMDTFTDYAGIERVMQAQR
ncbi:MAG: peptide chain release factor N(5)-glutamine methyltransferase [Bacteroidota bacterium]